jgi:thimet oligopeptidase
MNPFRKQETKMLASRSTSIPQLAVLALTLASAQAAPAPLIRYDYAKGEITKLCDESIAKATTRVDTIKSRNRLEHYLVNRSLLAFEKAMADLTDETGPLTFMAYVSKNSDLRDEGSACEEKVGQLYPVLLGDKPLYQALKRAIPLTPAQKRLSSETLRSFEKNGMSLDDAKLARLKELKQKLASLQAKFSLNLNNDKSSVTFTKDELEGLSDAALGRFTADGRGGYVVTTKSTDYVTVMENAVRADTRKRMNYAYLNRAGEENTKLLEEAVLVRQEIAAVLGYATWADEQIDGRMAKSKDTVLAFLNGLKDKLKSRLDADLEKLLAYKKSIDPAATAVNAEDVAFLANQIKKTTLAVDSEKIAEYFPADQVMDGLFETYSTLFGVKFVEVKDADVWAEGVKLYEIRDSRSNDLLAYFYKDTIPREGKYGHAAAFSLIMGRMLKAPGRGLEYSKPVSSIVANFTPPSGGKPSLLKHDEVETLFHEFGHIMHQTLTRAPYASLAGTSVAQDFVEAPSQMLENWVWNKEILKKVSSHYQTGEALPDELIAKMLAAMDFNQGYAYMRQLLFGLFDMKIHTAAGAVDVTKTYNELHKELFGFDVVEGTHFPASFGHMMGGYDAGYYGYLWSEVYAQDMFSRFEKEGLLSSKTGGDYRRTVLESGNMKDAIDLLREFLGREPNSDAFYRKLGI